MEVDVGKVLVGDELEGLGGSVGGEALGRCRRCEHEGSEGKGGEESLGAHVVVGSLRDLFYGGYPLPHMCL